ncbi:MAG: carbohydrate binding domain-containing protein [Candidatus Desulfofervidus auxilii]|nr:carbohydrate binding domain-containing protein [Candidatus Desulfofervidus auxilii]
MKIEDDIFFIILFGVISAIFIRDIIVSGEIVSDTIWYLSLENYIKAEGHTLFLWNDQLSVANLPVIFSYHIPLIIIAKCLNLSIIQYAIIQLWFVYTLSGICMYILIKNVIQSILRKPNDKILSVASFLGGLYYLANPAYTLSYVLRPDRIFYYAITPIVFLTFYKSIKLNKARYAVLSAIFFSLYSYGYRFYVFAFLLLLPYLLFTIIFELLRSGNKLYVIKRYAFILFAFGLTVIAINGWFLALSIFYKQPAVATALTTQLIEVRFAYASMANVIRGLGEITIPYFYSDKPPIISKFDIFITLLSFAPPILSILPFLSRKAKNSEIIYFLWSINIFTVFVLSIPEFRAWVILHSPLKDIFIGRAFSGLKAQFLVVFSFAILFAISIYLIIEKLHTLIRKNWNILTPLISLIFAILILIPSWPLLVGDLNNVYGDTKIPDEYFIVNEWLKNQSELFKAIWIPRGSQSHFSWSESKFDMGPIVDRGSSVPQYWRESTSFHYFFEYTLGLKNSLLAKGKTRSLAELLSTIGVKYLIVHKDQILSQLELVDKQESYLMKDNDFRIVYESGFIKVFENTKFSDIMYTAPNYFISFGGLVMLNSIYDNLQHYSTFPIVISDYYTSYDAISRAKGLFLTNEKNWYDVDMLIIQKKIIITPAKYTPYYNPKGNKWSRAYLPDPHHGAWSPFINMIPNHKWEFSYDLNYGFIFATKRDDLEIPVNIEESSKYYLFARVFKNPKGGEIKINLANLSKTINTREDVKAEFVWVKVGEIYLTKGKYTLKIENVRGSNAINILVLIPEKEYYKAKKEVEKLLQNKTVIYLFEAESDLYRSNAKTVKNIDASNGELLTFIKNGRAWQDIEIVKNGTYRLALRSVGEFKVRISDHEFILKSNSLNFTYTPIFHLTKGKYKLEVTPLKVKNLVKNPSFERVFAGLPGSWKIGNTKDFKISFDKGYKGKYSLKVSTSTTKKTWSWIRSEPIDVQPGRTYLVTIHIKYRNVNSTHIPIGAYYEDRGWKRLTVIAARITGDSDWQEYSAIIKIPENVTKIRGVLNAGWVLDESKGEAITWFDDVQVIPFEEAPKLDVIWLYSTETNQTLDQLFEVKEKPAEVIGYTKINPTLWKVKVNTTKPFMLSFAEAYDPLWEARIYKDGKLVEKVRAIPLYSVINGFWIDKTGELEIVIRYTPQDWFEIGLIISAITFVSCIGYLFYDWRREKGDKWAKEIERRLNEIKRRWKNKV